MYKYAKMRDQIIHHKQVHIGQAYLILLTGISHPWDQNFNQELGKPRPYNWKKLESVLIKGRNSMQVHYLKNKKTNKTK